MRAAVVTSFASPPAYEEFPTPTPKTSDEILVDVVASGLHPRVRSQANGSHYTSSDELPLIPGIDGVGRGPTAGCAISCCPTPPWAPWPNRPSLMYAGASYSPRTVTPC